MPKLRRVKYNIKRICAAVEIWCVHSQMAPGVYNIKKYGLETGPPSLPYTPLMPWVLAGSLCVVRYEISALCPFRYEISAVKFLGVWAVEVRVCRDVLQPLSLVNSVGKVWCIVLWDIYKRQTCRSVGDLAEGDGIILEAVTKRWHHPRLSILVKSTYLCKHVSGRA